MKNMIQEIKIVNHINYPDKMNKVYCRYTNTPRTMDTEGKFWKLCKNCPYFSGDYQGNGVECSWKDIIDSVDLNVYNSDPDSEVLRVSRLIDAELIDK